MENTFVFAMGQRKIDWEPIEGRNLRVETIIINQGGFAPLDPPLCRPPASNEWFDNGFEGSRRRQKVVKESPSSSRWDQRIGGSAGRAHVHVRCCMWWTPTGALEAIPARPALPQPRSEHKERPELRMAYAYHRSRALLLLNPPGPD